MKLSKFDGMMKELLSISNFKTIDSSMNGIQVTRTNQELKTLAFAVDASMETFRRAAELKADLLFVHHGLFWGKPLALKGNHYNRIKFLIDHDIALYAVHLPLDAHPELGNNITMARALGLENIKPFGFIHGMQLGFKGQFKEPRSLEEIKKVICANNAAPIALLPFGPEKIEKVGIISGGCTRETLQAIDSGLDLYITGDAAHQVYHEAREGGINVLFAGHYITEIWGVQQVARKLKETTDLEIHYIEVPTGL